MQASNRYQTLETQEHGVTPAQPEQLRREDLKLAREVPLAEPANDTAPSRPEARDHEGELEAARAHNDSVIEARIRAGKLEPHERVRAEREFDNQHFVEMKQRELQEARELAAEARAREAQARQLERDGRER